MISAARRNLMWLGLEAAASGGLSFASAFLVARLVGPTEFGVGAAAVALHVMFWVGVNALFADALVQRPAVDDVMAASAFWTAIAVGSLCALVQAAAGPIVAIGLGDKRLVPMCLLLSLPLPLVGAGGVAQGLLTRRRAYRALAGRAIIGQGLGTAAGVLAALDRAGAWAPVLQQFITSTAGATTLLLNAGWRPRLVWRWAPVRLLLGVALPVSASSFVLTTRYRLFALLLGGTAGATALGETHMAFRLVDTVRELVSTALWRLMLPLLSDRQHDESRLRADVDRLLRRSSPVLLPLCGAMALCLPQAVHRLLGPAWTSSAWAAEPLIALMGLIWLMFPAGVAVIARGQAGRALFGSVACLMLTLSGVALLHPRTAMQAVLVWCGAQALAAPYTLWINGAAVGTGPLRPLRGGAVAAGVTVAGLMAAYWLPNALRIPEGSVSGLSLRLAIFVALTAPYALTGGRRTRAPTAHAGGLGLPHSFKTPGRSLWRNRTARPADAPIPKFLRDE